jgi:ubiquinone/menaquinone biosynthesis C-methylase UbiE
MSFFNAISNMYDSWYETSVGSFVDHVETKLAFGLITPQAGMSILDVGCGTGNFSVKLAREGCQVTGIDISEGMLTIAREKARKQNIRIEFEKMDVYQLSFPANCFDGVISMAAFEFIKEPKRAFDEMIRVLKPGGHLLIGTIHKDSPWGEAYLEEAQKPDSIFRFADFKTMDDLLQLDRETLAGHGECLFIPPGLQEEKYNMDSEKHFSAIHRGGFIAALWKKPL